MATDFKNVWAEVLAQTWSDAAYRTKVEADPAQALRDKGIDVPKGVIVQVTPMKAGPETETVLVLPFPAKPASLQAATGSAPTSEMVLASSCCSTSLVSCCCP